MAKMETKISQMAARMTMDQIESTWTAVMRI